MNSRDPSRFNGSNSTIKITGVVGIPGPKGEPGKSEDNIMYSQRVDFVSDNLIYRAEAAPGTSTATAKWRIRKITIESDQDVTTQWAGGTDSFDKVWDLRLTYQYT